MTFTYTPSTPTDITRVRFQVGDTDNTNGAAMLSDEEITFQISETGTWKTATIACINSILARLALEGDFTIVGGVTVNKANAIKAYTDLLTRKRQELGVSLLVGQATFIYRPDNTNTTEAPTFDQAADDGFDLDFDGDDD